MEVGKAVQAVGTRLAEVGTAHGGEQGQPVGGDVGAELQAAVLGHHRYGLPHADVISLPYEERLDVAGGRSLDGSALRCGMLRHALVGSAGSLVGSAGLNKVLFGNDAVRHQRFGTFVVGTGGVVGSTGLGDGIAVLEVLRREEGQCLSGTYGCAFGNRGVGKAYDAVGGGSHRLFGTLSGKQLAAHAQGTLEGRGLQRFHLHAGGACLFGFHDDFAAVALIVATVLFVSLVVVSVVGSVCMPFVGRSVLFAVVVAAMAAASREGQCSAGHEGRYDSVHRVGRVGGVLE